MNTSDLLQSKWSLHVNFFKRPKVFINLFLHLHFIISILNIKITYSLGIKTVLYLKYNRFNGFVGV